MTYDIYELLVGSDEVHNLKESFPGRVMEPFNCDSSVVCVHGILTARCILLASYKLSSECWAGVELVERRVKELEDRQAAAKL